MRYTVGITQWCYPGFSAGTMPEVKKNGFDTVQLEVGSWEHGLPLSRKKIRNGYLEAAVSAGLQLLPVAVNTVCQHPFAEGLDTPDGQIALKALEAGIEAAAALHAEGITVPNFGRNKILNPMHLENTVLALQHACRIGLECGLNVYTENLLSAAGLERLFTDCSCPNLFLLFDSQNYRHNNLGYAMDVLRIWFPRTGSHIHVKAGSKTQNAPLGCENSEAAGVLAFLKDHQYTGSIVLENNYADPPLFREDFSFMLDDIRFVHRQMAGA